MSFTFLLQVNTSQVTTKFPANQAIVLSRPPLCLHSTLLQALVHNEIMATHNKTVKEKSKVRKMINVVVVGVGGRWKCKVMYQLRWQT